MPHCEHVDAPEKQPHLTYSVAGWMAPQYLAWTDQSSVAAGPSLTRQGYQSWFCQFLGVAPPALAHYANQLCPCNRHELDADHLHTCLMHSGNWWSAHELVLSAIAEIAQAAGYSTNCGNRVPKSLGQKRGDLEIKRLNVAGTSDIIIGVAVVHEFHGSVGQADRHSQLRHPNPDKVLIDKAVTKAQGNEYHRDYLHNHNKAFLPLIMSTSGRLHGEFVRLLYILAHRRAVRFFEALGYEPCYEELCQRRRSYFFQHRARIGLAGAQAVALCMGGNTRPPAGARQQLVQSIDAAVDFHFFDEDDLFSDPSSRILGA
jgi:hypothetical protein